MKKTLYLMRHGQTLFNARRKIQGACDSPLTQKGIEQAQVARDYFKKNGIVFDAAFSSTQERASDTLEIITDIPYERVKGLKEMNFGVFEGESEDLNPRVLPYGDYFGMYDGETQQQVEDRMGKTVADLMAKTSGKTVLMVSHGGAVRSFARVWEHTQQVEIKTRLYNCCILKFEYDDGEFSLVEIINHDF